VPVVIKVDVRGGLWFDARGMGDGRKLIYAVALALGYDAESQMLYRMTQTKFPMNAVLVDYDGIIIDSTIPTRDNEPEYIWFEPNIVPKDYIEMEVEACGTLSSVV